jgi:hypothetical protein
VLYPFGLKDRVQPRREHRGWPSETRIAQTGKEPSDFAGGWAMQKAIDAAEAVGSAYSVLQLLPADPNEAVAILAAIERALAHLDHGQTAGPGRRATCLPTWARSGQSGGGNPRRGARHGRTSS